MNYIARTVIKTVVITLLILAIIAAIVFLIVRLYNAVMDIGVIVTRGHHITYKSRAWADTPEAAIARAPNDPSLHVATHLQTIYTEGGVLLLYTTESATLTRLFIERNEEGQYRVAESIFEVFPSDPGGFLLNGDPEQEVQEAYVVRGDTVYGWKQSSAPDVTVNGVLAQTETYRFTLHNWEWEIDYFWVDGITGEVELAYVQAAD